MNPPDLRSADGPVPPPTDPPDPDGRPGQPATRYRVRGALLAAPSLVVLVLAYGLAPSPSGHGTHRQLALPECSFRVHRGLPCPSCGMTTSMARMAHADVLGAWRAQPFGVVLFPVTVLVAAVAVGELATGRDLMKRYRPSLWWVVLFLAGELLGWGIVLWTGFLSGRLPIQ